MKGKHVFKEMVLFFNPFMLDFAPKEAVLFYRQMFFLTCNVAKLHYILLGMQYFTFHLEFRQVSIVYWATFYFSIYHTSDYNVLFAHAGWLALRWLAKYYSPPSSRRKTKWLPVSLCRYIVTNKVTLWSASYSACVVYTETIIHLSVGESGGYLPSREAACA